MSDSSSQNNNSNGSAPRSGQGSTQGSSQRPAQSQVQNPNSGSSSGGNSRRRHHNRRRPHHKGNNGPRGNENVSTGNSAQQPARQAPENRPLLIDKIYEKYQNLLEQHLIARKKYHDLFYRADLAQKNKLERLFYQTQKDIRDFEARLSPKERELFEQRNNGLPLDDAYSTLNKDLITSSEQPVSNEPSDPHYMQSQKNASYHDDKEESVGNRDDYEKYKISH